MSLAELEEKVVAAVREQFGSESTASCQGSEPFSAGDRASCAFELDGQSATSPVDIQAGTDGLRVTVGDQQEQSPPDPSPRADCQGFTTVSAGVDCDEAQSVYERYLNGEGEPGQSRIEGTRLDEWTCLAPQMANGSICTRAGGDRFEADDGAG
ncbi:hypothetical protein GKE82_24285 [Conexibacter sp. W3-3-2]|uniref:hypothetical protein n=1 Tax=Conexibacter sp. W3-3-2 TaxID=2675227 RepID=UPI0012B8B9B8|nr:hypothetical protein [Conexibacter sp. W3-3-2]MTD47328.1 hypothetical protein [Conexibacter sp. W3-3-2]